MTNRRTLSFSILAAALLALCLPAVAAAQWNRYPDNQRNRDYGRNGRYDDRYLRDSVHRLDRLAKEFEREVDRSLDRSRRDGTRREDRINGQVRQFRNAVGDLKSRVGNGRDLHRSRNEAQRVLQEGRQLDRIGNRSSLWSQIRQELNVIAQAYGSYGYNDSNRRSNNNDWWRRLPVPY
jgi:opacity protein-like surface antigen